MAKKNKNQEVEVKEQQLPNAFSYKMEPCVKNGLLTIVDCNESMPSEYNNIYSVGKRDIISDIVFGNNVPIVDQATARDADIAFRHSKIKLEEYIYNKFIYLANAGIIFIVEKIMNGESEETIAETLRRDAIFINTFYIQAGNCITDGAASFADYITSLAVLKTSGHVGKMVNGHSALLNIINTISYGVNNALQLFLSKLYIDDYDSLVNSTVLGLYIDQDYNLFEGSLSYHDYLVQVADMLIAEYVEVVDGISLEALKAVEKYRDK